MLVTVAVVAAVDVEEARYSCRQRHVVAAADVEEAWHHLGWFGERQMHVVVIAAADVEEVRYRCSDRQGGRVV